MSRAVPTGAQFQRRSPAWSHRARQAVWALAGLTSLGLWLAAALLALRAAGAL